MNERHGKKTRRRCAVILLPSFILLQTYVLLIMTTPSLVFSSLEIQNTAVVKNNIKFKNRRMDNNDPLTTTTTTTTTIIHERINDLRQRKQKQRPRYSVFSSGDSFNHYHHQQQQQQHPITTSPRGGGNAITSHITTTAKIPKELFGILYFTILDISLRKIFISRGITFPSMMAGCLLMFVVMVGAEIVKTGAGDAIFGVLSPGADVLSRWVSVFFVPGVVMLPTAPSLGSGWEVAKVGSIIVFGFLFSLLSTCYSVVALRTMQGKITKPTESTSSTKSCKGKQSVEAASTPSSPPPKPYSEETLKLLTTGALVSFPLSIHAQRINHPTLATPLNTIFMLCTSLASFVFGARLPPSITKIIHPLIITTTAVLLATLLTAHLTTSTFLTTLKTYKTNTLTPLTSTGAGDILLFMLGPAVTSLSTAMYSRKTLMTSNLLVVVISTLVSSLGGLFSTALYVRFISLSGSTLRKSVLTRSVTTALAMATTEILGGNTAVTASVVVVTGIIGATYGRSLLNLLGVTDPVARGLGIGAAAQGLGAASMIGERDAFPFAAICMILTAVVVSGLVEFEGAREFLLRVALKGVVEENDGGVGDGV